MWAIDIPHDHECSVSIPDCVMTVLWLIEPQHSQALAQRRTCSSLLASSVSTLKVSWTTVDDSSRSSSRRGGQPSRVCVQHSKTVLMSSLPPTIANAAELTKRQLLELANMLANAKELFATNAALDLSALAARQVHPSAHSGRCRGIGAARVCHCLQRTAHVLISDGHAATAASADLKTRKLMWDAAARRAPHAGHHGTRQAYDRQHGWEPTVARGLASGALKRKAKPKPKP